MMGHQDDSQDRLFYSFNLDEHVPRDHLLRCRVPHKMYAISELRD